MHFEEKIELLKKTFLKSDFSIPFSTGSEILISIEKRFITIKDLQQDLNNLRQHHNSWSENIKNKSEVKCVDINIQNSLMNALNPYVNYWVVLVSGTQTSSKHLVYDCKPKSIAELIKITPEDFFIVEKKYKWLTYFKLDKENRKITIYKSGQALIPFES